MNDRKLTVLAAITAILALGEFGSAVQIGIGADGPDRSGWPFGAAFGVFFLVAAWLLRRRRITAGAVFAGILCLFEVLNYPSWYKHGALDWTYDTAFALVSLAGLIGAVMVLAGRFRRRVAA
jgi:MYXO-CTERM domain-containing protein